MVDEAASETVDIGRRSFGAAVLLRPMPPRLLIPIALLALIAGAFYCSGYQTLLTGFAHWPGSLLWALYGVIPWLLLFEFIKRREWDADRPLSIITVILLMVMTITASVAAHLITHNLILGKHTAPIALQFLRRLPAVAATTMLLLLSRREQLIARQRLSAPRATAAAEADALRQLAQDIRWIRAADNYLELHLAGQISTRRVTLKEAADMLEPRGFVRIHRSLIVNREHVARVVPQSRRPAVEMKDGTLLPTGRAFSGNLYLLPG